MAKFVLSRLNTSPRVDLYMGHPLRKVFTVTAATRKDLKEAMRIATTRSETLRTQAPQFESVRVNAEVIENGR